MPTNAERIVYLDSSALVKLVVEERESDALRRYVRRRPRRLSSGLARAEVVRAVRPHGVAAVERARSLLDRLNLVRLEDALLDSAALLGGMDLRTLDAIHLASAWTVGGELDAVVTYDARMASAATSLGLRVAAPR